MPDLISDGLYGERVIPQWMPEQKWLRQIYPLATRFFYESALLGNGDPLATNAYLHVDKLKVNQNENFRNLTSYVQHPPVF